MNILLVEDEQKIASNLNYSWDKNSKYSFHIYALSKPLDMSQSDTVSATTLRKKMASPVLSSDSLTVSFERSSQEKSNFRPK